MQPHREGGLAEAIELPMKGVAAGVFDIGLEGGAGRERIGAGQRDRAVTEALVEVRIVGRPEIRPLEQVLEERAERAGAPAAAELPDGVTRERPAAHRLDADVRSGHFWRTRALLALPEDVIR